LDWL